jgi:hypothetical protein
LKPGLHQFSSINLGTFFFRTILCFSLFLPLTAHPAETPHTHLSSAIASTQDAEELYALAIQALASEQPELAQQALERVVGMRPRFAGAWLDLAIATYRSGDAPAALEHLEYLRGQFNLPPAVASQVDYWHRLWQSPDQTVPRRGWQGEVATGLGYDSNANAGLSARQLPISLPGGSVLLDVNSTYLPRADTFWSFALSAWGPVQAIGAGRLNPVIQFNSKQLFHETEFSTIDIQPGLLYEQAAHNDGSWQIGLFAQHYRLGGQTLFNGLRAAGLRHQPWRSCRWTGGGEIENRHHQRVDNLGGTRLSLIGGLGCRLASAGNLSATLKIGEEHAHQGRPGGDHQINELFILYDQPIGTTQRLQASWQIVSIKDQQGYSPLLENNAPRQQHGQRLELSLRQAIAPRLEARLNYEYLQQKANLALFEQRGHLVMLGIVYRFD